MLYIAICSLIYYLTWSKIYYSIFSLWCRLYIYYIITDNYAISSFFKFYCIFCLFKVFLFFESFHSLAQPSFWIFFLLYQPSFFLMFFEKYYKKSFYKAINKHGRAFNLINSQFFIFYKSANIVIYDIDILYLILALEISCQSKACFIIIKYLYLFDYVFW